MVGANPDLWLPLCDTLGIREKVRLIGQTERVSDYLQIADAFVFPSKNMDSAPNTLLEAIRMGLPVVAATVGGVPEIAQNNGLLVPPDDTEALTRALQEMASDPERRKLWGANSARRGQSYSVEARCIELEKYIIPSCNLLSEAKGKHHGSVAEHRKNAVDNGSPS